MLKVLFLVSVLTSSSFATPLVPGPEDYLKAENSYFIQNEQNTMEVFKNASPLVVSVDSTRLSNHFFSSNTEEIPTGSGSGFIWDKKGHIITNFHVIQGALNSASQIWISTNQGERFKAEVVGTEPKKDIAVLKVSGLKTKSEGFIERTARSGKLQVGQKVLAIGNPFGFEQSLTTGIVSALNRSMPSVFSAVNIRNMIQTDASINPGNSGGPLLDSRGYLVGMNTAIVSRSGSSAGIGFAVPADTIKSIATQIINFGEVRQPGLGITSLDGYRKMMLARYGYDVKDGVVIEHVNPGSPAAKAGLRGIEEHPRLGVRIGDVITAVDNVEIKNFDDLYNTLSEKKIGDLVNVKFRRMGRVLTKNIKLEVLDTRS